MRKEQQKIGIMTYWQHNYGSILQCYATCKVIRNIGYQPVVFSEASEFSVQVKQKLLVLNRMLFYPQYKYVIHRLREAPKKAINNLDDKTKEQMTAFVEMHIPTEKKTRTQWQQETRSADYAAFLTGSDQVWSGYRYTDVDNYFLRFVPAHKRIAWAPSFGTNDIAAYNVHAYKKYISEIPFLSVREKDGMEIVKCLTGRDSRQLIDPVYLLTSDEWKSIVSSNDNGEYVLCYFLDEPNNETVKRIGEFCDSHKIYPMIIGKQAEWHHKIKNAKTTSCGPEEFVSLICYAEYLFTDSFHGVSFALILHTPFYAFHRNYTHGTDQSSRMLSILQMFNFESAYEPEDLKVMDWNFADSDSIIKFKREEMIDYLIQSVNSAKTENKDA